MTTGLSVTPSHRNRAEEVVLLAAEAVMATLLGRAPNRLVRVSLPDGVQYAVAVDAAALQLNRGLLEDVVMVRLASSAASRLTGLSVSPESAAPESAAPEAEAHAARLLQVSLTQPEEQAVIPAYLQVLEARVTALLRNHWAEVQVVAAGLAEAGELSAEAVRWRMDCAQGIRGQLLN